MRFCWHNYKVIHTEQLVTVVFIFIQPTGERRTLECQKCGKQKTKKVSY
jgi:hypothetical protein